MVPTSHDTAWVAEEFDRRAATYDASEMHVWQGRKAAELLELRPGQRVLDIATGTGMAARAIVQLAERTTVVGVDVSARMLDVARSKSDPRRCRYVRADAQRLPFGSAVFDGLLCVAAIPYLPDLGAALSEWGRVGRPGATLVFTTPAADGITAHRLLGQAAEAHGLTVPNPHAAYGSPDRIRAIVEGAGLSLVSVERDAVADLLDADPRSVFDRVIEYGFAEPIRAASGLLREAIFGTYADLYSAACRRGDNGHDTLFTRCRLPGS
jgi:SAM-dependent methyltransferase